MPAYDADLHFFKSGEADNLAFGQNGATITTNTSAVSGSFAAIQFITAGAFSALTIANGTGTFTGVTFPAGFILYGRITGYTLSSGSVIAYKYAD